MFNIGKQSSTRRIAVLALLSACGAFTLGGCVPTNPNGLLPGTYDGELACTAMVESPDGAEGTEEFTMPMVLVVDAAGDLSTNDEPIIVGELVTRSLPNADLAFEVLTITEDVGQVSVTYAPRPTLPGITVTGDMVETYQRSESGVTATGRADLVLTDVSGDSTFVIECTGSLPQR